MTKRRKLDPAASAGSASTSTTMAADPGPAAGTSGRLDRPGGLAARAPERAPDSSVAPPAPRRPIGLFGYRGPTMPAERALSPGLESRLSARHSAGGRTEHPMPHRADDNPYATGAVGFVGMPGLPQADLEAIRPARQPLRDVGPAPAAAAPGVATRASDSGSQRGTQPPAIAGPSSQPGAGPSAPAAVRTETVVKHMNELELIHWLEQKGIRIDMGLPADLASARVALETWRSSLRHPNSNRLNDRFQAAVDTFRAAGAARAEIIRATDSSSDAVRRALERSEGSTTTRPATRSTTRRAEAGSDAPAAAPLRWMHTFGPAPSNAPPPPVAGSKRRHDG